MLDNIIYIFGGGTFDLTVTGIQLRYDFHRMLSIINFPLNVSRFEGKPGY